MAKNDHLMAKQILGWSPVAIGWSFLGNQREHSDHGDAGDTGAEKVEPVQTTPLVPYPTPTTIPPGRTRRSPRANR